MVTQCWVLLYTDNLMDIRVCDPGTIQSEVLMPLINKNRACLIPNAYSMLCKFISEEETTVEYTRFYNEIFCQLVGDAFGLPTQHALFKTKAPNYD